jgi:nicotinate phosphoribosyltransferase
VLKDTKKVPRLVQHPEDSAVSCYADKYFLRTKDIVERFNDTIVTYAVFMRRPVTSAPKLAVQWLQEIAKARKTSVNIDLRHKEGAWIGAGEPIVYITGSLFHLVDLETQFLQKLGAACVAAYNAYVMCVELPKSAFLAMDARHCAGTDMAELMAYGASVGSRKAQKKVGALGFIGNATDDTAHFFGQTTGFGTMPHALIGYAGSTVRAAEMFHDTHPNINLTVLVDYFGKEITDAIAVCARFPDLASSGKLAIRLDTHGGRYVEGLDMANSYAVLERNATKAIRGYRSEAELRHLIGTGVSAAAIWHLREALNKAGYPDAKIVGSSGFSPEKCRIIALAEAPVDVIGTGSYLPENWSETYATADIIDYDGMPRVKVGREFLLQK